MTSARAAYEWLFEYHGSSRSSGLLRIGLALLIAYRFYWGVPLGIPSYGIGWAIAFHVATLCMLLGIYSRISALVTGMLAMSTYYWFYLVHGIEAWNHHHTYFVGFSAALLSLTPCGRSYSLDRWLDLRRARKTGKPAVPEEGALFGLRLLAILMGALYFFAFWDKTIVAGSYNVYYNFLNGSRLEQILLFEYLGSDFQIEPYMKTIAAALALTVAGLELILPLVLFRPFQKWLFIPGLGLHLSFYVLLPLYTYSLTCILLYLAIFDANMIHGIIEKTMPDADRRKTAPEMGDKAFAVDQHTTLNPQTC